MPANSRTVPDGVFTTPADLLGMEFERFLATVWIERSRVIGRQANGPDRGVIALRRYLAADEGTGFWDVIDAGSLFVCVADATYLQDYRIPTEGEQVLELRILLEGQLLDEGGEVRACGPRGEVEMLDDFTASPYLIAANQRLRMIVLRCPFAELNRIMPTDIDGEPIATRWLSGQLGVGATTPFAIGPDMAQTVRRIFESRYDLPGRLRHTFIAALATDLLCTVLGEFARRANGARDTSLTARDVARVIEARDYLADRLADPPRIAALARLVGMNQTKLKLGFREVLGETIYGFVLRRRMEAAADMLLRGDAGIAEIAYRVGYDFPANFTSAFKRHFGTLPRDWRSRHASISQAAMQP